MIGKSQKEVDQSRRSFDQLWHEKMHGTIGVISSYNHYQNTATVLVSKSETGQITETLENVVCPVTLGVQTIAPTPGLCCWVAFKDGKVTQPIITHYYNHRYDMYNYNKQNDTKFSLPSYLMG